MTCFEKLREIHPEWTDEEIQRFVADECPDTENIARMPEWCDPFVNCEQCWDCEVPGADPTPAADEPHIRDSGSRTEFSTGAVRDIQKGKGRCDLMPLDVVSDCYMLKFGKDDKSHAVFGCLYNFIQTADCSHLCDALGEFIDEAFASWSDMFLEVSKHFEEGAEKYGENNWQKGLPVKCYINSAVRHYLKWLRCDNDENHHLAFCWNVICAWWTCKHKPELNDYAAVKKSDFDPDSLMGEYEEEND